jgi:alpha-D-xyloside xylohydrolase
MVGEAYLVAPVIAAGDRRDVALPAGSGWYDWYSQERHEGGTTLAGYALTDRRRIPIFVREGAILPLRLDRRALGLGTEASHDQDGVMLYPGASETTFARHDEDGVITTITSRTGSVTFSRVRAPTWLWIRVAADPTGAAANGTPLVMVASRSMLDESPTAAIFVGDFPPGEPPSFYVKLLPGGPTTLTW